MIKQYISNYSDEKLKSFDNKTDNNIQNMKKHNARLLSWLTMFYKSISREDHIDMKMINKLLDALKEVREKQTNNYLTDLLFPELACNAKIPVDVPITTSSFTLHNNFTITTNTLGNFAVIMNPQFLTDSTGASTIYINISNTLTGLTVDNNFVPFIGPAIGQTIPANVYQRYRLVSASIQLRYIYREDATSGVFGAAIGFEDIPPQLPGVLYAPLARYGIFNIIDQMYFNTRQGASNGVRLLYIPMDTSTCEFTSLNVSKPGSSFFIYGQGFPSSIQCVRIDCYCNFECLADPILQKYIPVSPSYTSDNATREKDVKKIIEKGKVIEDIKIYEENIKLSKIDLQDKIDNEFKDEEPAINADNEVININMLPPMDSSVYEDYSAPNFMEE